MIKWLKRILREEFTAVDDVSFNLNRGDGLGLISLNGAVKSTLLKIVAGVMKPTTWRNRSFIRIRALLEIPIKNYSSGMRSIRIFYSHYCRTRYIDTG